MIEKLLWVVVTLGSVVAMLAVVSLAGCEPDVPTPKVAAPADVVPRALTGDVYCLDGWEVILTPNGAFYRHAHDVNEHLISCKGD